MAATASLIPYSRRAVLRVAGRGGGYAVLALLAACGGATGPAGAVPPAVPTAAPPTAPPATALPAARPPAAAIPAVPASSAALASSATPIPLVSRPLKGILPRQVTYANLEFRLTDATITNQDPSGQTVADRAFAYINATIVNATRKDSAIGAGLVKLALGGDAPKGDENGSTLQVPQDGSADLKLQFLVPITATWEQAAITISRPDKEPAMLPLYGPPPTPQYPLKLLATGSATAGKVDYSVKAARFDLDYGGARVAKGSRFLICSLLMVNNGKAPPGGGFAGDYALLPESYRLMVDGLPLAPLQAPNQLLPVHASYAGDVVFTVPAATTKADLQVGEGGGNGQAIIPVDLKPA